MRDYVTPLLQLQRFFVPVLLIALAWAIWRTLIRKDIAVGLALYIGLVIIVDGFYNTGIYVPGFEKGSVRYSELCALFLLFYRSPRQLVDTPRRIVGLLVGAYFLLMFVAALRADPLIAGIFDFRRFIVPQIVAYFVASRGLVNTSEYRRFFLCLTGIALTIGIFAFWDVFFDRWVLHSEMLFKPEYFHNRKLGRFGSIFLNPNYLGAFVVLVFPSLLLRALAERQSTSARALLWIALLALIFSLVETQSRGPLLAFALSLLILILGPLAGMSRSRRIGFVGAGALVLFLAMPGFFETAIQRFSSIDNETSEVTLSRYVVWEYTRRIISQHPILGVGLGEQQFLAAMDETDFKEQFGHRSLDNPHNSYLQIAVYAGIPALCVFIAANALLIWRSVGLKNRGLPSVQREAFGLSVGILGFLISIYPDMHLFTQTIAPLYWLFFGLLASMIGVHTRSVTRTHVAPMPQTLSL